MRIVSYIVIGIALLGLGACSRPSTPYDLPYKAPENAPPEYKLGWEHGCKSGYNAYGNDYYKTLYSFTQDVEQIKNPTYSKAWTDSYNYCRSYINRYLAGYGFSKPKAGDGPAVFSNTRLNFLRSTNDLRKGSVAQKKGLGFGIFEGVDTPGWGGLAWGSKVPCEQDWLGATSKDCGGWGGRRGNAAGDVPSVGSFLGY